MEENKETILEELKSVQGHPVDLGGYFDTNDQTARTAMRPSSLFNDILENLLEPTKIFFDNLPLNLSKEDIKA